MRITVNVPKSLYDRLESLAARQGMSVRKLLRLKLELMAGVNPNKGRGKRVRVPVIPSKKPGSLHIDNAKIYDLIGFP